MKLHLLFAALVASTVVGSTLLAADEAGSPLILHVPDATDLAVVLPAGTTDKLIQPDPAMAPTLKVTGPDDAWTVQISCLGANQLDIANQGAIDQMATAMGAQHVHGSVEQATRVQHFAEAQGLNAYADYTAAALVDVATPPPGQFKVASAGVIAVGKTLALFTVAANGFDTPGYRAGLELVRGLAPAPAKAKP